MTEHPPWNDPKYTEDEARKFWEDARAKAGKADCNFEWVYFPEDPAGVYFTEVQFGGHASFQRAEFGGGVDFINAGFAGGATFLRAKFGRYADFFEAEFGGDADFWYAEFGSFSACGLTGYLCRPPGTCPRKSAAMGLFAEAARTPYTHRRFFWIFLPAAGRKAAVKIPLGVVAY